MAEAFEWTGGIVAGISGLALWGAGVLYTRWNYIRNRQFSTMNDEKRYSVFRKIRDLEDNSRNVIELSMLRTLYESLGMFYPHKINRLILEFIEARNLKFSDVDLNYFLKSQSLILIDEDTGSVEFDERKFSRKRWSIFVAFLLTTAFFFGGAVVTLGLSKHQTGPLQWVMITFGATFYLIWIWFLSMMLKDIGCGYGARRFCRMIASWLSQKIIEEKAQHTEQLQADELMQSSPGIKKPPTNLITRLLALAKAR